MTTVDPTRIGTEQVGVIFLGYLGACLIAALVLILLPFLGGLFQEWAPPISIMLIFSVTISTTVAFLVTLVLSLPGFVALRLGLHLLKRYDLFSFALVGMVNAWLVLNLLSSAKMSLTGMVKSLNDPETLFVILAGGLAGLTSWAIERHAAKENDMTTSEAENP